MNAALVIFSVGLAVTGLQASPAPVDILPVFEQPFGPDGIIPNIVKGKEAGKGQFPHQAAVVIDDRAFCGGSLISKDWVLTAAHCVKGFSSWAVSLGAHNLRNTNEEGRVNLNSKEASAHKDFDARTVKADVGVIKLPKSVALGRNINVIALPPRKFVERDFAGQNVRVSGWGRVSDSATSISPTLNFVDLNVISTAECRSYYGAVIDNKKYCCSGEGGKGTCSGDSGGSLTIMDSNKLVHLGIVSFGAAKGCALGYPSGYTATTYFLDWIKDETDIEIH